ncbi:sensor histidine kinase [Actinopolymorpha singaporensis]|uniref:histidine kinase n=1 Tax=Actinopolymorpha singaporensis TaxID=117157 RepID=A0A1H1YGB0_9ACTN|nr:histidine kinase [Actinopolymorpha singaporensis]SDT20411.1 Signal transduction histidine kinase [Actinopolymorpha singaporensis]
MSERATAGPDCGRPLGQAWPAPWARRWRRWLPPGYRDVLLAFGFVVGDTLLTLSHGSWWPQRPGTVAWFLLGLQVLVDAGLVLRRRAPLAVLGAVTAYTVLVTVLVSTGSTGGRPGPWTVWAPVAAVLVAYLPVAYPAVRRPGWVLVGLLTLVSARIWDPSAAVVTIAVLRTTLGPLLALYFGARHRLVSVLRERAERAEREKYLLAAQARADERARIAAEMHDVVTHRLSLMVLSAGALRVRARDEETRRSAEELRAAGCQALDELRDLVGILRMTEDAERPAVGDLATLVAESESVGIRTELAQVGDPGRASPVVGRTAYRVVQEALTNVRKHAPGASVSVEVRYDTDRVGVRVTNTAPAGPPDPALAGSGSGTGLAGLRQRIELVRGTLSAGPTSDGGFEVVADLPAYVPTAAPAVEPVREPTPETTPGTGPKTTEAVR